MDGASFYTTVGVGLLLGALYGGLKYLRAYRKGEAFDLGKFEQTILIGAVIGAVSAASGRSFEDVETWLLMAGGLAFVNEGHRTTLAWLRPAPLPPRPPKEDEEDEDDEDEHEEEDDHPSERPAGGAPA